VRLGLGGGLGVHGGRRAIPVWRPTRLTSLKAYYPPAGITITSNKVSAVADASASGFNLSQGNAGLRPGVTTLAGRQGMSCAAGTFLVGNAASIVTTRYTIAAVLRPTVVESGTYMFSVIGSDFVGGVALLNNATRGLIHANVATGTDGSETLAAELWIATWDGAAVSLRINGVAQSLSTPPGSFTAPGAGCQISIGAFASGTLGSSVDVFEPLVCNAVLSAADLARLERYYLGEYGIA